MIGLLAGCMNQLELNALPAGCMNQSEVSTPPAGCFGLSIDTRVCRFKRNKIHASMILASTTER